jgi:hypothetical protein
MHLECLHVNICYKVDYPHSSCHKLKNIQKKTGREGNENILQSWNSNYATDTLNNLHIYDNWSGFYQGQGKGVENIQWNTEAEHHNGRTSP